MKNSIRTEEETKKYLKELKSWLEQARGTPVEEMSAFFGKRLDVYEDVHLGNWREEYENIASFLPDGCARLLDIGCGTGLELRSVFARFPDIAVTCIDLSPVMLEKLRVSFGDKNIEIVCADYFRHPFGESVYDAALSFETLHHFPFEEKGKIYKKLFGALKSGGTYVECDYVACCEEEEALCLAEYCRRTKNSGKPDGYVHIDIPLTLEKQKRLFERAGFMEIETPYVNKSTAIFIAKK